jgi:hypothetical protein
MTPSVRAGVGDAQAGGSWWTKARVGCSSSPPWTCSSCSSPSSTRSASAWASSQRGPDRASWPPTRCATWARVKRRLPRCRLGGKGGLTVVGCGSTGRGPEQWPWPGRLAPDGVAGRQAWRQASRAGGRSLRLSGPWRRAGPGCRQAATPHGEERRLHLFGGTGPGPEPRCGRGDGRSRRPRRHLRHPRPDPSQCVGVERTYAWSKQYGKLRWCTERGRLLVAFWLALASTVIVGGGSSVVPGSGITGRAVRAAPDAYWAQPLSRRRPP